MKILLTGITGQVGHALQSALTALADVEVIALDRAQLDLSTLTPDILQTKLDVYAPDLIINPAAYTAVDQAEDEVELAHKINALAPALLAQAAKSRNIPLIHYSTDYVFDGQKRDAEGNFSPYLESDTCEPISVYGQSKLQGEIAIRDSGCDHLILRTSWVYSDFGKNFLLTMLRLAKERDHLNVVNDQWGAPTSANWIATVTAQLIQQSRNAADPAAWWRENSGTVHITPANSTTWCEFANTIFARAAELGLLNNARPSVSGIASSDYPTKAERPGNSKLSTEKLRDRFYITAPQWQESLSGCLKTMASAQTKRIIMIDAMHTPFRLLGDERGSLIAVEAHKDVPFSIARVYYIFGTKEGVERGFHAHKTLRQVAVAVRGSCTMMLDDGRQKIDIALNDPARSVKIDPMIWHEMKNFSEDCVLLVFADQAYDEGDYIRNYDAFLSAVESAK